MFDIKHGINIVGDGFKSYYLLIKNRSRIGNIING